MKLQNQNYKIHKMMDLINSKWINFIEKGNKINQEGEKMEEDIHKI